MDYNPNEWSRERQEQAEVDSDARALFNAIILILFIGFIGAFFAYVEVHKFA